MSGMRRRFVTLVTALTFTVLATSGVIVFIRPFSMPFVGLHALMGFVFIMVVGFHVKNNFRPLKKFLKSPIVWPSLAFTLVLTTLFFWQPHPITAVLGLSGNMGPALERFELHEAGMRFHYAPAPQYTMELALQAGKAYDTANPPSMAIWLENQGGFHIKTLFASEASHADELPYWAFKVKGWEQAKREAEADELSEVDGLSGATPNGSFDPADYILPAEPGTSTPYTLLIEINQPGDAYGTYTDQPSLVYAVEIDNAWPKTYQLLDLMGYPKREEGEEKEAWSLYYVDDTFGSATTLIDSALLTIQRK